MGERACVGGVVGKCIGERGKTRNEREKKEKKKYNIIIIIIIIILIIKE